MQCSERGRIGGEASAEASIVAAAEIGVLNNNHVGDGLGVVLAGGAARVLASDREFDISPGVFPCVVAMCTGILYTVSVSLLPASRPVCFSE
jgi:hypothetical protein